MASAMMLRAELAVQMNRTLKMGVVIENLSSVRSGERAFADPHQCLSGDVAGFKVVGKASVTSQQMTSMSAEAMSG